MSKAVKKVKDEMEKNNTHPYVQTVGQFLLEHLGGNPDSAEKILVEDKTILKSLEAMRFEASKKKVGNVAVLTDQEGFDIVLKYFGITESDTVEETKSKEAVAPEEDIDSEFDDLLK